MGRAWIPIAFWRGSKCADLTPDGSPECLLSERKTVEIFWEDHVHCPSVDGPLSCVVLFLLYCELHTMKMETDSFGSLGQGEWSIWRIIFGRSYIVYCCPFPQRPQHTNVPTNENTWCTDNHYNGPLNLYGCWRLLDQIQWLTIEWEVTRGGWWWRALLKYGKWFLETLKMIIFDYIILIWFTFHGFYSRYRVHNTPMNSNSICNQIDDVRRPEPKPHQLTSMSRCIDELWVAPPNQI